MSFSASSILGFSLYYFASFKASLKILTTFVPSAADTK
jgi:hypothetical protein